MPDNNVERRGRRLNPNFLRALTIASRISNEVSFRPSDPAVFELGAGVGHVAHVLKTLQPAPTYVIVDLPETLFFSYLFLSLTFPEARTVFVTKPEDLADGVPTGSDFVFVPTMFAEELISRPYDVFVNTASLGEMPNREIRHWMDFTVGYIRTVGKIMSACY